MTIRFNKQGYKPTKKERIEHNMDTFERKVGKVLDYYNAGEVGEEQFINEIRVAHGNYKHNQRRIYNSETTSPDKVTPYDFKKEAERIMDMAMGHAHPCDNFTDEWYAVYNFASEISNYFEQED